jgi:hypothetical protein
MTERGSSSWNMDGIIVRIRMSTPGMYLASGAPARRSGAGNAWLDRAVAAGQTCIERQASRNLNADVINYASRSPGINRCDRHRNEVLDVACNKNQTVRHCSCRQQTINRRNRPSCGGNNSSPAVGNGAINWKNAPGKESRQVHIQPIPECELPSRIAQQLDPLADFAKR